MSAPLQRGATTARSSIWARCPRASRPVCGWAGPSRSRGSIRMLALAKQCSDLSSSMFAQAVALELLETHFEDAHVPRIRACYRERRDALHALAQRELRRVVRDGPAVRRHVPVAAGTSTQGSTRMRCTSAPSGRVSPSCPAACSIPTGPLNTRHAPQLHAQRTRRDGRRCPSPGARRPGIPGRGREIATMPTYLGHPDAPRLPDDAGRSLACGAQRGRRRPAAGPRSCRPGHPPAAAVRVAARAWWVSP